MLEVIDSFRENIRTALVDVKQSSRVSGGMVEPFGRISRQIGERVEEENALAARTGESAAGISAVVADLAEETGRAARDMEAARQELGRSRAQVHAMVGQVSESVRMGEDMAVRMRRLSESASQRRPPVFQ